jgi:hypothetical protein
MIFFPVALFKLYPVVARPDTTTTLQWKNWTEYLLAVMLDEWFEWFSGTHGIVVRTGETYTFDSPYHAGSSPMAGVTNSAEQQGAWIGFLNFLREAVCIRHGRKVIFRTWDIFSGVD